MTINNKSKIVLVVGPTASGKTKLSIDLAKYLNAEIINADSRYLYKEPCIATAKVTEEEMNGIKHHMIDIISLNDEYSIYSYQLEGRKILDRLIKENKNVVIVGGSGLYIKALLYDYDLKPTIKSNINLDILSNEELKVIIDNIYKNNDIHVNNRQRMERYYTYYLETGNLITKKEESDNKVYDFITIGLKPDRDELYSVINNRVEVMFNNGLLKEANRLKDMNHFKDIIGFKELLEYYNKEITLEEAKENIKKNTRHFAKRQMTWFNNQMQDINWYSVNYNEYDKLLNEIKIRFE